MIFFWFEKKNQNQACALLYLLISKLESIQKERFEFNSKSWSICMS